MNNVVPFEQQQTLARAFAQSGLFGIKTPEQALALMALCEAEGMHPAKAIQRYHIVQGRPAMKADTMLAEFQKAGGKVEWREYTDAKVTGVFSHPAGGSVAVSWDMIQAAKAGLSSKDVWKHYPRSMMRSRCISEGVRAVFPGVVEGIYTPEEMESLPPDGAIEGQSRRVTEAPTLPDLTPEIELASKNHADKGTVAYGAWFKSITKPERLAVSRIHEENKAHAAAADAKMEAAIKELETPDEVLHD